ncbi:LPXTG cell wall anchor domain-containing protein, partial [Staphylococcus epidermidis]
PLPIDDKSYVSWLVIVGISLILVTIVSIFLWRKQKL